jgi:hypothetical protein
VKGSLMRLVQQLLLVFMFAFLLVDAVGGCFGPVHPTPLEEPDAGDYPAPPLNIVEVFPDDSEAALSSPCGKACYSLRRIPCREGYPTAAGVSCYRGCLAMASQQRVPTKCWMLAKTPAEARDCGGIRCLTP